MSKIILNNVSNLQDTTTAASTINNNNGTIQVAMDNTLSRDGTSPNQMNAAIDMNSYPIANLPNPLGPTSPLRLQDLNSFIGGGTIHTLPVGGSTGMHLIKQSNVDYDANWGTPNAVVTSVGLALPADFTVTNSPVTTTGNLTGAWATTPTGTGAVVRATSPILVTPVLGTPTSGVATNLTGTAAGLTAGTASAVAVGGITGLATGVSTFLATPSSANLKAAVTDETGSGTLVFATTPTLVTPVLGVATATSINGATISPGHLSGEPSTGSAVAGEVGEYIESVIASGSAVSLSNGVSANITSISLTAGDWDIDCSAYFTAAATTSTTAFLTSLSPTTATLDQAAGRLAKISMAAFVPGAGIAYSQNVAPYRFSFASTTSIFLVVNAGFTVSTLTGWGIIRARRVR
jgi:hypothetical protein